MADESPAEADARDQYLRAKVKGELRKRMRGLRGAMPAAACSARSERIVRGVLALDALAAAKAVALFWPMERRHEVDLRSLDACLRERGVRVAYPRCDAAAATMTFHYVEDPGAMREGPARGAQGALEPSPADPPALPGELEVIVVPALAVDPTGHRIGYGAGHYDATLPLFSPPAATVAVAFDFQLVAEVPATARDVAVQWVVTDSRSFRA